MNSNDITSLDPQQIMDRLNQLNGNYYSIQRQIERVIKLFESSQSPDQTRDEITLTTNKFSVPSYGYPFIYLFVDDSDASATLTVTDGARSHEYTLAGGWNTINALDGWNWYSSKMMNAVIYRSKIKIF